jgi:hypothetical protein
MNRRSFLRQGYGSAATGSGAAERPATAAKDGLLEKVAQAALAMQRHSWEQGILAQAFLDMNDRERVILMAKGAIVEKALTGGWRPSAAGRPIRPWAERHIGAPGS